mgnify:CR=1 FL=1
MKVCPRCGYENPDEAQFCLKCHYPLFMSSQINLGVQPSVKVCPRCGHQNPPDAFFCEKCHYPLFEIRETKISETVKEEKSKLPIAVFEYLLISSIIYIASFFLFSFFPLYMSILNAVATIFLSLAIYKAKITWYYYFVNLSPVGLFLIKMNQFVGFLIFSFSGLFISDLMRILFLEEKDEIFRIVYIIFLIGYLGGLLIPLLYDMITVGFLVLIMESIRRISEERRKRKDLLPP